jgi:hypothetical protein
LATGLELTQAISLNQPSSHTVVTETARYTQYHGVRFLHIVGNAA